MDDTTSTELNRHLGHMIEDSIKLIVKWLSLAIKAVFEFGLEVIRSILGK